MTRTKLTAGIAASLVGFWSGCYFARDNGYFIEEDAFVYDQDGDGQDASDGDCNDFDANVFFGAIEDCADGVDTDCDGKADDTDPECAADCPAVCESFQICGQPIDPCACECVDGEQQTINGDRYVCEAGCFTPERGGTGGSSGSAGGDAGGSGGSGTGGASTGGSGGAGGSGTGGSAAGGSGTGGAGTGGGA